MSFFGSTQQPVRRCTAIFGTKPLQNHLVIRTRGHPVSIINRFASRRTPTNGSEKLQPSADQKKTNSLPPKSQVAASQKATLLLKRLTKVSNKVSQDAAKVPRSGHAVPSPQTAAAEDSLPPENRKIEQEDIEIDEQEEAIQRRIITNRRKLLWPGIWTVFAVAGTYGAFAYFDIKYNPQATITNIELSERHVLPQTWFLTPNVVLEGFKTGWKELDKLTIGVVVASFAIHLLKRSPLPIWQHLIHITGEKKYTAFTYPFVHTHWEHIGQNMFALCWFLPGVVCYFDGDLFHSAAFLVSVPLITSYLQHFAFRWGSVKGIPLNLGSSGAVAAVFGAFCMAYPDEKVWTPSFLILRLDAKYWAALFAIWQFSSTVKTPKGGDRPAFIVHLISLGLGAAYVYFDGKEHIWKPLIARFSKEPLVVLSQ